MATTPQDIPQETATSKPDSDDETPLPPPKNTSEWVWRHARRVVVFVIGTTVLLIGVAMMVLPGPAFIVIPAGLAILATEFVWARRLLKKSRQKLKEYTSLDI